MDRPAPAARPGPEPEGLLPGEDLPAPAEWTGLVESFRSGRLTEAQAALGTLAKRDDGWLLGPELRVNRAVLLAARGRRDEARHLLLRVGDSRFPKQVDQLLEGMGSPARKN